MLDIAKSIEHTILKPDTTLADVKRVCEETAQYGFAGVCIPPLYVRDARRLLEAAGSKARVVTVVGFPMGYSAIAAKSEEIKRATDEGADDIDAVINIAAVKTGQWNHVLHDIDALALATNMRGRNLKLILECGFLTDEELKRVCQMAADAKINWLKTGTGFHGHPATPEMVKKIQSSAVHPVKIKASGGIKTFAEAQALLNAGAERIGSSAGVAIVSGAK